LRNVPEGVAQANADAIDGGNRKKEPVDTALHVGRKVVDAAAGTDARGAAAGLARKAVDTGLDGDSPKHALRVLRPI